MNSICFINILNIRLGCSDCKNVVGYIIDAKQAMNDNMDEKYNYNDVYLFVVIFVCFFFLLA